MPIRFEEAIEFARRRRVVLPEEYYGVLRGRARALAFSIAGIASLEQLRLVLDSLVEHMERGGSFEEWVKRVRSDEIKLDLPKHRLDNIFRTNLQTHYMAGRCRSFFRHKKSRPYLRYVAVNDHRTRPSHRAMHGTVLPVDHPWWRSHLPPNGFRSLLPWQRVSGAVYVGLKAFYAGPAVEITAVDGSRLAITAQHPVLTARRGWVPAELVEKGDELFCYSLPVGRSAPSGNFNEDDPPPTVEEVFKALPVHVRSPVPASSVHLYGDEKFIDGQVEVVCSDRRLLADIEATILEHLSQHHLTLPDERGALTTGNGPRRGPDLIRAFQGGYAGGLETPLPYLLFGMAFSELLIRTLEDAMLLQYGGDALPASLVFLSQLACRRPTCVFRDDLIFRKVASEVGSWFASPFGSSSPTGFLWRSGNAKLFESPAHGRRRDAAYPGAFLDGGPGEIRLHDLFRELLSGTTPLQVGRLSLRIIQSVIGDPMTHPHAHLELPVRFKGLVRTVAVKSVRHFRYRGPVYDLETASGAILAFGGICNNHFVISNCRCTAIAITAKQAERYGITATPPRVNPDPGWDYSVCHDGPGEGVRRAIRERQSGGDPLLNHPKVKKKLAELRAAVDRWQDLGRLLDETMERAGRRTEWRDLLRTFEQDARNLGTQPYHLASLRLYSDDDYGPINHLLRTLFSDEFYGDLLRLRTDSEIEVAALLIKAIDEAFERMPKVQGTFYRGLRILSDDLDRFLKAHKVGAVVFYAAYSSTSKVDDTAFSGNVQLIFEGASGIDLEPFSAFPGEKEVLLPRGGTFRVVKVVEGKGEWRIYLEEVPMSEKEKKRIPESQRFAQEDMPEWVRREEEKLKKSYERWVKAGRPVTEGQRRFIERCTDETLTSLDVMEALKRQGKWPPKKEK